MRAANRILGTDPDALVYPFDHNPWIRSYRVRGYCNQRCALKHGKNAGENDEVAICLATTCVSASEWSTKTHEDICLCNSARSCPAPLAKSTRWSGWRNVLLPSSLMKRAPDVRQSMLKRILILFWWHAEKILCNTDPIFYSVRFLHETCSPPWYLKLKDGDSTEEGSWNKRIF